MRWAWACFTNADPLTSPNSHRQDVYVSVMGQIKSFNGKRHISAQNIRPITDHNEVFYHLLESLYVTLTFRNPTAGVSELISRV